MASLTLGMSGGVTHRRDMNGDDEGDDSGEGSELVLCIEEEPAPKRATQQ